MPPGVWMLLVFNGRNHGGHASNFCETGLFITTRVQAKVGQPVHVQFGFGLAIASFPHASDGTLYGAFVRQLTGGTPRE